MSLNRRHLDVGLFCLLLLMGILVVRGWMRESEALPSPTPRADAKAVAALPPLKVFASAPAGPAVDLLGKIDPVADRVAGTWTLAGGVLRSSVDKWARLRLPCLVPEDYELRLRVTRLDKTDALILGAVCDGARAQIVLDGNGGRGSWMEVKGGTHGIGVNGVTYFDGPVFANGRPAEVVVSVRKGRLDVRVDGFQVLAWLGSKDKLYVAEGWDMPQDRSLFLGAWQSIFAIDLIEIASPSGQIELLR